MASGESSKLSALDFVINPEPTGLLAYGVNTLDTAPEHPAGKSVKAYYSDIFEGMVPSAAALSEPGALYAYIIRSFERTGICQLPSGVITIPNDETIRLNKQHGGIIRGTGQSYAPTTSGSGWLNPTGDGNNQTTTIRKVAGTTPVFELDAVMNVTFEHFSVENPNHDCFFYDSEANWGAAHIYFNSVGGLDCRRFLYAYSAININAADVVFNRCIFNQCDVVLEVRHNQGVNWLFQGQCYFYNTEIAVYLRGGGYVHLDNSAGHTVKTWIRADQGGGDLLPTCRITNLYSDRSGTSTPPVIIDFSRATGPVSAIIDGFRVTDSTGEYAAIPPNTGHPMFIAPTGAPALFYWTKPTGTLRCGITVRDIDYMLYPRTFIDYPISTGNPYGNQGFPVA